MKKYLLLLVVIFFPLQVNALSFKCPDIVSENEEFSCMVEDYDYRGVKAKYKLDSVFSYVSSKVDGKYGYYNASDGFVVGNNIGNRVIKMEVKFKTAGNIDKYKDYNITLSDVEATGSDYSLKVIDDVVSKIKLVSNINTLSSLSINNGNFSNKFNSSVASYNATVNSDSTVISAVATDKNAKVSGDIGTKMLKYGMNIFTIRVTSVRGNTRDYKIYITRPYNASKVKKSSDATLKSLKINPGKISFKSNIFYYDVNISYVIDDIDIEAIPNNKKAKVNINKPKELKIGDNEVKITVTSEDGTKLIYVIVVHKLEKLSSDATIRSLIIKGYDIDFASDKYKYDLSIYNEDKLDIIVLVNDDDATYKIKGNKNLTNGSAINIEVKAPDGSTKNYIINISKVEEAKSKGIFDYVRLIPILLFIVLLLIIIVLKIFRSRINE